MATVVTGYSSRNIMVDKMFFACHHGRVYHVFLALFSDDAKSHHILKRNIFKLLFRRKKKRRRRRKERSIRRRLKGAIIDFTDSTVRRGELSPRRKTNVQTIQCMNHAQYTPVT